MEKKLAFEAFLPDWMLDAETQAVVLAGLCCVGAWVIVQWIVQMMFSVLWPFFVVCGLLICFPSLRKAITDDFLPKQYVLKSLSGRYIPSFKVPYTSYN